MQIVIKENMLDILNWSLEHPLATFLWFLMILIILEKVCDLVLLVTVKNKNKNKEN